MQKLIQTLRSKTFARHGILTLGTMTLARLAHGQALQEGWGNFGKPIASSNFTSILQSIADTIVAVAIPFVVVAFVWVGFLFASARGNEEKLTSAKHTLTWTVVGTAVIAGVYVVIDLIQSVVI